MGWDGMEEVEWEEMGSGRHNTHTRAPTPVVSRSVMFIITACTEVSVPATRTCSKSHNRAPQRALSMACSGDAGNV
jgi:hypothetical protein